MKKIVGTLVIVSVLGCSSLQTNAPNKKSTDGKHFLPPNTASNKYSKIRQGGD